MASAWISRGDLSCGIRLVRDASYSSPASIWIGNVEICVLLVTIRVSLFVPVLGNDFINSSLYTFDDV
jgi:hypothetical protein